MEKHFHDKPQVVALKRFIGACLLTIEDFLAMAVRTQYLKTWLWRDYDLPKWRRAKSLSPRPSCSRDPAPPLLRLLRSAHPVYAPRRSQDPSHQKSSAF